MLFCLKHWICCKRFLDKDCFWFAKVLDSIIEKNLYPNLCLFVSFSWEISINLNVYYSWDLSRVKISVGSFRSSADRADDKIRLIHVPSSPTAICNFVDCFSSGISWSSKYTCSSMRHRLILPIQHWNFGCHFVIFVLDTLLSLGNIQQTCKQERFKMTFHIVLGNLQKLFQVCHHLIIWLLRVI